MTGPMGGDDSLVPRPVRAAGVAVLALVLASAVYLMIVRGPAMLIDLAATTFRAICF